MHSLPALLALALTLTACSSIDVTTEKDPAADLSIPRTFAWMMEQNLGREGGRLDRENTFAHIVTTVEECLATKGWELEQNPDKADVLLAFQVTAEEAVSVTSFQEYDRNPWTWNRFYGNSMDREVRVRTYDVGTLVLDIVLPSDQRLLWRGTARAEVGKTEDREAKAALAVEAVRRMFAKFPGR